MRTDPLVLMRQTADGLAFVRTVADRAEGERACRADPALRVMTRLEALREHFSRPQTVALGRIERPRH